MSNIQKILFSLLLILISTSYFILKKPKIESKTEVIHIPPLKIEPEIKITEASNHNSNVDSPSDILSTLRNAVTASKTKKELTEDERAKEILAQLKKSVHSTENPKKLKIKRVKDKKLSKKVVKRVIKPKKPVIKKKRIAIHKKVVNKKVIHKKVVNKKVIHKKVVNRKVVNKKVIHKKVVNRKRIAKTTKPKLEVVKASKPDSYYFEKNDPTVDKTIESNKFVETLGVVSVSKAEEVDFTIPQKVEQAQDGVVDIPSATIETEELKKLKFVKPIETIEVSKEFEASDSYKYLKN